jgi:hypothetical protein
MENLRKFSEAFVMNSPRMVIQKGLNAGVARSTISEAVEGVEQIIVGNDSLLRGASVDCCSVFLLRKGNKFIRIEQFLHSKFF